MSSCNLPLCGFLSTISLVMKRSPGGFPVSQVPINSVKVTEKQVRRNTSIHLQFTFLHDKRWLTTAFIFLEGDYCIQGSLRLILVLFKEKYLAELILNPLFSVLKLEYSFSNLLFLIKSEYLNTTVKITWR